MSQVVGSISGMERKKGQKGDGGREERKERERERKWKDGEKRKKEGRKKGKKEVKYEGRTRRKCL